MGTAGWVSTVLSVDPARRFALIAGLRAAQHACRGVIPGRRARREARRLAGWSTGTVRLDALAEFGATPVDARSLSRDRDWLVSDAAVPGAVAVVHFAPGCWGRLVHWAPVPTTSSVVTAELSGVAAAARYAKDAGLERPVFVTDSRTAWCLLRRGVCRSPRHVQDMWAVRSAFPECHLVWIPSALNTADGPSRDSSYAMACDSARQWAGPFRAEPKRAEALAYCLRRFTPPSQAR